MKEILLTQGKVALVDDEDFERLNQYKWYASWDRYNWYATRYTHRIAGNRNLIRMHREIMNAPKGIQVDHRNGDGLYNLKENLRLATTQQNAFNKNAHKDNKIGVKGVTWKNHARKFRAQIKANNKIIHLGYFSVLGDADSAYRKAEEKYFGEFARCHM